MFIGALPQQRARNQFKMEFNNPTRFTLQKLKGMVLCIYSVSMTH